MVRRILHLDIDAFLASVEQLVEPALVGRPVVVGTGVVASRSYEAKARGVETAMRLGEARRRCPELVVCAGDARRAERFRQAVAETVYRFTPVVEVCSLDDLYADLTGVPGRPVAVAEGIRAAVRAATGLSVAQGIGATRTVARLATVRAKPGGVFEVPAGEERAFLGGHAARDLPGVGRRTAALLDRLQVHTVAELAAVDDVLLERTFGTIGPVLGRRARGADGEPVRATPPVQSVSRESSFEPVGSAPGAGRDFLLALLAYLLDRAAAELRARALRCRTVQVGVHHVDGAGGARRRSLRRATDRTDRLWSRAAALLEGLLERRVLVRRVGVTLTGLRGAATRGRTDPFAAPPPSIAPPVPEQGELFDHEDRDARALFAAVDTIRRRHGFAKLVYGRSAALLGRLEQTPHGFRLRTPSLTK